MMSEIDCNKCRWFNNCQSDCVGYEPKYKQTNEEWFFALSTEEKAEWLARKLDYCANMDCENCPVEKECNDGVNDYSESELWEKWLKEKHNDN